MRCVIFILLLQLSTIVSLAFNDIQAVDATIKSKISALIDIENIGHVQSVKTTSIGPLTFYRLKFFAQNKFQVSANAVQFFAFSPRISCVLSSKNHSCQ